MSIFVRARFDAHDERQADVEELIQALCERTKGDPGTRTFRWFSAGAGSYVVLEEYTDSAAALAHNRRAAVLLARVGQCADMVSVELYGAIGPELRAWVRANPQATTFADRSDHHDGTSGSGPHVPPGGVEPPTVAL